mgnify:CR=1 FL=1
MERSYLNRLHDAAYYKIVVPFEDFVMAVFLMKKIKLYLIIFAVGDMVVIPNI